MRTFLAPANWLGFGPADFLLLEVSVLLALALWRFHVEFTCPKLISDHRNIWTIAIFIAPIALRLAILPRYPAPAPSGADDFGYLLLADTIRHGRLANPQLPLPDFFEQIFVLQRPTFSSMFNLGQGLVLALGWMVFAHPWAGVLISIGVFCASVYWMLRAWTTCGWALVGACLAIMLFGPVCYWSNCYWGGAVSASAGCLVFGSLPRLTKIPRTASALLLGIGLAAQLLTRPFEFLLLAVSAVTFFSLDRAILNRTVAVCAIPLLAAGGLILLQNKRVTGSWTILPYQLYRYQYGIPATFTFQPNAVPHERLNAEKELDYRAEAVIHGDAPETVKSYFARLFFRVRFLRFFLFAPLYVAAAAFLWRLHERRLVWVVFTLLLFALGSNLYPYFYPHYAAALSCLFILIAVVGAQKLGAGGLAILILCALQFTLTYGLYALGYAEAAREFAPWDFINYGDPQGRIAVERSLEKQPGKQLVFVRYSPEHRFAEWIHNSANVDASKTIWVHDLGPDRNQQLIRLYPDRAPWLLLPDAEPPVLQRYLEDSRLFQDVQ
ncbi:MAG: hypothetical protein JO061_16880 [Acidobacteriaceae bacterium]|nr:hypothetical protein [Acidobacteriaceae bacterium]